MFLPALDPVGRACDHGRSSHDFALSLPLEAKKTTCLRPTLHFHSTLLNRPMGKSHRRLPALLTLENGVVNAYARYASRH